MSSPRAHLLLILAASLQAGCSGAGAVAPGPEAAAPALHLAADTVRVASLGTVVTLRAWTGDAAGSTTEPPSLAWASSDPAVAAPLGSGRFRAAANGAATVSVWRSDAPAVRATAVVVVEQVAARLHIGAAELTLAQAGDSRALAPAAWDAGGTQIAGARAAWSSADPAVATVDAAGVVTATGAGVTHVIARLGAARDSVVVRVAAGAIASR